MRSINESSYFSVANLKESGSGDCRVSDDAELTTDFACLIELSAIFTKRMAVALVPQLDLQSHYDLVRLTIL